MIARRTVDRLLDTAAAACAAAVGGWSALERPFVWAGCATAGLAAGRAVYRRACARLVVRLRAEDRTVRRVTVFRQSLLLDVSDTPGYRAYFDRRVYEPALSELVAGLREGDTFLDVGANVGFFTILGARAVGPTGRVYAFEPHPDVRSRLLAAVARNGVASRVHVVGGAVGVVTGDRVRLYVSDRGLEFSSLVPHRAPASPAGFTAFVEVETVSLDSWLAERPVDPALIKIDVEGAEDLVVGGMEQTLRARPPRRIVCETVRGGPADAILRAHGYRVRSLEASDAAMYGNFLYERDSIEPAR